MKRILVIDDEAVFRDAMCDSLVRCGFSCVAEEYPSDGINRLKSEKFDLILLDIMMDPFDGWDTLEHIKKMPHGQNVPVIMASAKSLQADEIIRYGDQVAGFLKKPFYSSDFCDDVRSFLDWYDLVKSDAMQAELTGIQKESCDTWVRLSRQINALTRLREIVSHRCIPSETSDEETCLLQKLSAIDASIQDKILERDEMLKMCPYFIIR